MKTETTDTTPKQRFLKIDDLASALCCSRSKAYALVSAGEVRAVKVGGLLRIPASELDRLAGFGEEPAR